jgi:hypothetical protein
MYKIEKLAFGYKLTFAGSISESEIQQWYDESVTQLASAPSKYGVLIDMRTIQALVPGARDIMMKGQQLYKSKGMERSAVIVNSAITKMQFTRLARESGIYEWERYIDASGVSDCENVGIAWIQKAQDPDAVTV